MISQGQLSRLWERLTRPAAAITDEGERVRARLISSMLLLIAPVGLLSQLVVILIASTGQQTPIRLLLTLLTTISVLATYTVSRTRHYQAAVYALVLLSVSTILIGFYALLQGNAPAASNALYFLVIPVIISGVFVTPPVTGSIALMNVLIIIVIGWTQPSEQAYVTAGPLIFNLTLYPLLLLAFQHFAMVERSQAARREKEAIKTRMLSTELESEYHLNQLKDQFIATVSHEFRTPLATILSSSEILQIYSHKLDDEKRTRYFNKINSEVQRMTRMVEDVLTISKVSSGTVEFSPEPITVHKLCREIAAEYADSQHPIDYTCQLPDTMQVVLDRALVEGALRQILDNAVMYSPPGSTIHLEVEQHRDDLMFRVRDHGIGIPPEDQERVFEVFQRGSNVSMTPGTGLGLRIAWEYVQLHGGKIDCESVEHEGTTFTIRLPLIAPEQIRDS